MLGKMQICKNCWGRGGRGRKSLQECGGGSVIISGCHGFNVIKQLLKIAAINFPVQSSIRRGRGRLVLLEALDTGDSHKTPKRSFCRVLWGPMSMADGTVILYGWQRSFAPWWPRNRPSPSSTRLIPADMNRVSAAFLIAEMYLHE